MFDVFGEFNSAEEINKAAEGQKKEGDKDALTELAIENGLDKEDAEDYFVGITDELCTPLMAALGKLNIETAAIKGMDGIYNDWITYIHVRCSELDEVARAVRKKEKSLAGCIGSILKYSFDKKTAVPQEITKAAGINGGGVEFYIPDMATVKKIISDYYLK